MGQPNCSTKLEPGAWAKSPGRPGMLHGENPLPLSPVGPRPPRHTPVPLDICSHPAFPRVIKPTQLPRRPRRVITKVFRDTSPLLSTLERFTCFKWIKHLVLLGLLFFFSREYKPFCISKSFSKQSSLSLCLLI